MKFTKILFLTVPLLLISALVKGSNTQKATDKCKVNFRDIILENIKLLNTKLKIRLGIENPTDTKLKIKKIDVKILLDDTEIGNLLRTQKNYTINKQTNAHIDFFTYIKNTSVGYKLYQAIINGKIPESLNIKGQINVNGYNKDIDEIIPLYEKNK